MAAAAQIQKTVFEQSDLILQRLIQPAPPILGHLANQGANLANRWPRTEASLTQDGRCRR
jgi:hypothetical protein